MYDDFGLSLASPFDPFDPHYDAQPQRVRQYRLDKSTGVILPGQYSHGRVGLVFNTFNLFKVSKLILCSFTQAVRDKRLPL